LLISGIAVLSPRAVHAVVATIIRDQDNPARHPFTTSCLGFGTAASSNFCTTPAIPAGQEVVIETISFAADADPGNTVLIRHVTTVAAGVTTSLSLNPTLDSGFDQPGRASFEGTDSVRLYADPGSVIRCDGFTAKPNPSAFGFVLTCTISGYFVTLP